MADDQLKQISIAVTLLITLCIFGWIILALHRVNYIPELFLKSIGNRENFSNYTNCIGQGYSKEYCSMTPVSVSSTDICQCPSGLVGRRLPGFGGACVCDVNLQSILKKSTDDTESTQPYSNFMLQGYR